MKALKYGFGLILVGGFALTASCGGSSGDDSSSAAGSTSSAGTSDGTAGTGTGTGGTDSGTGGGTGTAGNGTTTGGTGTGGTGTATGGTGAGTGGAGTAGAGGGAATNPAGCPAASTMPKTGDACTATAGMRGGGATVCTYAATDPGEDTTCGCAARGGGRGPGGGAAGAPDVMDTLTCATTCAAHTSTPPTTGEACTLNAFTTCTFGPNARTNTDRCRCMANKWACTTIGGMGAAGAGG
jgi:hypothetical protein